MSDTQEQERDLFLNGEIDGENTKDIIASIIKINTHDNKQEKKIINYKREPIKLYINTPGGYAYDGFALINIIKNTSTPIYTIGLGRIMSMGIPVLLIGNKRYAYEYSSFMIHEGATGTYDKLKTLNECLNEGKRLQNMVDEIILNNSKLSKEFYNNIKHKRENYFFSAQKALELGIIDEIVGLGSEMNHVK